MQLRCIYLGSALSVLLGLGLWSQRADAQDAAMHAPDAGASGAQPTLDAGTPSAPGTAQNTAPNAPIADAGTPLVTTPPRLLQSPAPIFPAQEAGSGEHPTVVLKVTVFADGSIGDVVVEHSAGEAFDAAASQAVRNWSFAPARRGDVAIASRVGVAVHFELPELGVHEITALTEPSAPVPHEHGAARAAAPAGHAGAEAATAAAPAEPQTFGARAQVSGVLRSEERGASDFHLESQALKAAPSLDGADLLKRAPGMVVARIEGDAVAPHLMLRGFDADHGQDIELSADGVPINQPSHIHGQGYADLGFIIPETVRGLRVTEGVYDPRQGDFAVAGSADFELGVERRGLKFSSGYGSFHTFRELALYAPEGFGSDTFGAAVFRKSDGFGQNRAATQGSAVAQIGFGRGPLHLTLHGSLSASRALTANVLRRDDIDAGRIGFYDVYPLPTAEAQGANAQRAQVSLRARYKGKHGENGELLLYFVQNDFRLQVNYTGFTQTSQVDPSWAGRGDLIEQQNRDRALGFKGRYRTAELEPFDWARVFLEMGVSGRFNEIAQSQNLIEAPDNTTWDRRIDADISGVDVGGYIDADIALFSRVHLRGGVRADLLSYRVADALGNVVPSFRAEEHLPGYRRSAAGMAVGPRVTLQVDAWRGLALIAAYGEGYRSPMALLLDDGERAPFAKVRSADFGLKYVLDQADHLTLRASGFWTRLSDDVAFEPSEGRATPIGPSQRKGFTFYAQAQPLPWLFAALSTTYVHASLENPPYASPEDPAPPFHKGQLLPYVPSVVVRADLSLSHSLASIAAHALNGRIGAGYSYWSPRPLPYGEQASPVSVMDAEAGLSYRMFRLSLSCFNLLDQRYAALELSYPSSWDPNGFASRVPARHIMAGAPRTLMGTLEISL